MPYTLHWDLVTTDAARIRTGDDRHLVAIWPSPGAQDAAWERNTWMTIDRLLASLGAHGTATLASAPLTRRFPLMLRLFISEKELPLSEQVKMPMFDASVPPCEVRFGNEGVSLRTGAGRALWWVELPVSVAATDFIAEVAAGLPVMRTSLPIDDLP